MLCLLGSQRLTLWTIVPESELPSLSSQPRLFPSVLTLFQSLTRSFISSGATLHARISSPYPSDLLWTKISRTAWVWKWIVRESSSVPENTIETTAHDSTGLVSGTQHSWVGLGYTVLLFHTQLDCLGWLQKKVIQSFSRYCSYCCLGSWIKESSWDFHLQCISWASFSSVVIHSSDITPIPAVLPYLLLAMLRSMPRTGTLLKVPGNKNLCCSIISHVPYYLEQF